MTRVGASAVILRRVYIAGQHRYRTDLPVHYCHSERPVMRTHRLEYIKYVFLNT